MNRNREWTCKIGYATDNDLARYMPGADAPLRKAVAAAYKEAFERAPDFCESGWGKPEANLGLATTEQLLEELRARFTIHVDYSKDLPMLINYLEKQLTPKDLAYRTVEEGEG